MQGMLETAVDKFRRTEGSREEETSAAGGGDRFGRRRIRGRTAMVNILEVGKVISSIGHHRHDGGCDGDAHGAADARTDDGIIDDLPLKMRWCHPLLDHLGDDIDRSRLGSLTVEDFLCDDGFHPGRYGTAYIVSLIAASYAKISGIGLS